MTYTLNCSAGSQIVSGTQIEAANDSKAIKAAMLRSETENCELWSGERLVAKRVDGLWAFEDAASVL